MIQPATEDYEYHIFVSYRRSDTVAPWVIDTLLPLLKDRLEQHGPQDPRIFCDRDINSGVHWPSELRNKLRRSGLLIAVWSADYFRHPWCMTEWRSFREREIMLGRFTEQHPQGLIYPVRYADGEYFHAEASENQCKQDFSELTYTGKAFRDSEKWILFEDRVTAMAKELIVLLKDLPKWQADFPIKEGELLAPVVMQRPGL